MLSEHFYTDYFAHVLDTVLGPNHGVVVVKQDGMHSGTGPFAMEKHDFFEFPSGMQVPTAAFMWNEKWGMQWYMASLAAQENVMVGGASLDLRDGHTPKFVHAVSPCLDKFRS